MNTAAFVPSRWTDRLECLVGINSVSAPGTALDSSNRELVQTLSAWLGQLGFDCRIQTLNTQSKPAKFNLYARIGPETDGGLVLSGHTDTVPAQRGHWRADPWRLQRLEDRVVGLGCADMKGFFASLICALERVDLSKLRCPLAVVATADEESNMSGAALLDEDFLRGFACVIIGEPTDLRPIYAHKGVLMERIRLHGRAGHSSRPHEGRNAIAGMQSVAADLMQWQKNLRQDYAQRDEYASFDVRWPTTNLGHIRGGDIPNRVAADCLLDIDHRFFADTSRAQARAEIHRLVMQAVDGHDLEVEFEALFEGIEALHTPKEARLIRCLERCCQAPARGVSFATEGPFYSRHIPEVAILGPGRIDVAHQADEWLSLAAAQRFDGIVAQIIAELCLS